MTDALDGLLELANLKEKKGGKTELREAVSENLEQQKKSIEDKHLSIETHIPNGVFLKIDPKHFSLLFTNLLKNAITYNKQNGKIIITYKK